MSVRFGWEHFIPGSHDRLMLTLSSKDLFIKIALWFQCYLARHQDAGIYQITDFFTTVHTLQHFPSSLPNLVWIPAPKPERFQFRRRLLIEY